MYPKGYLQQVRGIAAHFTAGRSRLDVMHK